MSLFAKIFGKKDQQKLQEKTENTEIKQKELREFFIEEIEKSPYIKESGRGLALSHCLHEINLFKDGEQLTKEEKNSLGFRANTKITKELINILTDRNYNPLGRIESNANHKFNAYKNINNFIRLGIKEIKVCIPEYQDLCDWCKSVNDSKITTSLSLIEEVEKNCKCGFFPLIIIQPVINFD